MSAETIIDRISEFLRNNDLSWLLPNLRQDYVVWKGLTDPKFFEGYVRLLSQGHEIRADHFSPCRLALYALGQGELVHKDPWKLLDSIDEQVLQSAIQSFTDHSLFLDETQDLIAVGNAAIALASTQRKTNAWNGLIESIGQNPEVDWSSALACLFGLTNDPTGMLTALIHPASTAKRIELAVHIILSNPIRPDDQITMLLQLCHGNYGELLPARERTILVKKLFEQSPQIAAEFCAGWLEAHPEAGKPYFRNSSENIENIRQLEETLFQAEVTRIAGTEKQLKDILNQEHELAAHVTAISQVRNALLIPQDHLEKSFPEELITFRDQLCDSVKQNTELKIIEPSQAYLAMIMAEHGLIEDACQLIPDSATSLPDDADVLFAMAKIAKKSGNQKAATDTAERIISIIDQKAPGINLPVWGDTLSLVGLGKLLVELEQPERASKIYEKACKTCPNDVNLLLSLADCYQSAHKKIEATETLRVVVNLALDNLDYHRKFARSLETVSDWETALKERSWIIESNHGQSILVPVDDIYAYANCALQAHRPELAIDICNERLTHHLEDWQALIYCGNGYVQQGDTGKGMEYLTRATQVAPQSSKPWLALIEAQMNTGQEDQVIETLNQACLAVPESAEIHLMLGEAYLRGNAPTLALPELKAAEQLSPEDPRILFGYGRALKQLGHVEDSREVLSRAYQLEPMFPSLAGTYADILVELGELEEAIGPLEVSINEKPYSDIKPYMDYARCIISINKDGARKIPPMKSLVALNEVLQIDPNNAEAKALIAETLASNGDKEMAFQAYREALDTSLIEDKTWLERLSFGFGCVANSIGKHDIAIAALQEAAQANPTNTLVLKALSDAYLASGLVEDAIRAARNVLVICENDPDHLAWFANQVWNVIHATHEDSTSLNSSVSKSLPSEGLNALAKAIHLAPMRTDLLLQLGTLQANLGAQAEARATFNAIAALDFAGIDDLLRASDFLSNNGDYEGAVTCLENAIAQDGKLNDKHNPLLYVKLARQNVKNSDPTSAINTLETGLEMLPGDETLLNEKIEILLGIGQSIDALHCIETALKNDDCSTKTIDLLFLAAKISHTIGDFSITLNSIQKGLDRYLQSRGSENLSGLPSQYLTHIAEIFRALMQPDLAYKLLLEKNAVPVKDFEDEEAYLDYVCLHTELALETGQPIRPDIQDILPESSDPKFPRVMAITARLMNKAGNYKQAEQIFQIALNNFGRYENSYQQSDWSVPHINYLTNNSILAAALDLGLWQEAQKISQKILETSPSEPMSYLNLAKTFVLKAEYYNLCDEMEVTSHKPEPEAVSRESYIQFSKFIGNAKASLDTTRGSFTLNEYEISDDLIYRWQTRAEIAYKYSTDTNGDPLDFLSDQNIPGDAVAVINHLHQLDLHSPDRDSITKIIKIARSYPRNPAVLLHVALAIHDENPADAMRSLQSILEQNPYPKNPVIAFCNILLTKVAMRTEHYRIAQEAIENAISFWNDEPNWHALAAQLYGKMAKTKEQIKHLSEATKLAPENNKIKMALGRLYFEHASDDVQMLRQAAICFEQILERDTQDGQALFYLASTEFQLNELEKAEANARNALVLEPNRAEVHQLLSEISLKNDDFQGAYEYANKALQLSPKDLRSTVMLARSLAALGRHNEALAKINAILPDAPEPKSLQMERVDIIRRINGARSGLIELEKLLSQYPADFDILNALAKAYLEIGDPENAIINAQNALNAGTEKTSQNEQANLHLLIGQVYRQSGHLDESIDHLNKAIELAPDRLEPYLELGLALKERREYQQALQIFEQATTIDPADPRAPFQAGLALKESKDYKLSETMLRRAVSLAPNDLNIRRQLAAVVALNLVHNPRSGRN